MNIDELSRRTASAFDLPLWRGMVDPIDPEEVRVAIEEGQLNDPATGFSDSSVQPRKWHIERIAWFVVHGFDEPLLFCGKSFFPILDGNHRFASAVYRRMRGESVIVPVTTRSDLQHSPESE
jgi:hypothetical protein